MSPFRRWLTMVVLCFSGGIIFMLPFLREVYYKPMQDAFSYDNTQMGVLISVFGAVSLLTYFPGGWIADRFSPRKLMASALLATGLGGLYFATYPSYAMSILIHGFWGACISLVFWAAMIKTTRNWAPASEQGKAFGVLEAGRGLAESGSATLFLVVFAWYTSAAEGFAQVVNLYSYTNIGLAVLAWFIFEDSHDTTHTTAEEQESKIGLKEVIEVLKMSEVWLISIIVLTAYCAYWGSYYFAPYATDAYALSAVVGATIAVGRMWIKPVVAVSAGLIADKIGISKSVFILFIMMTACFVGFGILPGGQSQLALILMLANVFIVTIAIYAVRGIYFALLDEGGVAPAVTGTAVGVISAIGFTPDVFMPLLGGVLLDAYPGAEGYRYYYLVIAALCAIGTMAAFVIMRRASKHPLSDQVESS